MKPYRAALRHSRALNIAAPGSQRYIQQAARRGANGPPPPPPPRRGGKLIGLLGVFAVSAGAVYYYPTLTSSKEAPKPAEAARPLKAEIEFEQERAHPASKEGNRDLISSQHLQVKNSWEHPGVYAWGSNSGKVIDPDSKESYIKVPKRIPYFEGQLLRDIKLTQDFGAAVNEKGNIVQWGLGFSNDDPRPVETLRGKDITNITVSDDRIIALSSSGSVYAIPASRDEQDASGKLEPKTPKSSSWIPFWSSGNGAFDPASVRNITPSGLGWGEKVVEVSSGQQHCLILTSKGRVFSSASSTSGFPTQGQMGIPGLTWANRPKGPFDQPHEIFNLRGHDVVKVATGDLHSVVLDKDGRILTFGDNTFGQLGIQSETRATSVDVPTPIPVPRLYTNTGLIPRVTTIAAGGLNTFFTVDASSPDHEAQTAADKELAPSRRMPGVTSDVWACGNGIYGSLGTGKWTHVAAAPSKVKALSSLFEFDEARNKMAPIRVADLAVGGTHTAVTMANVTRTGASSRTSENDTNWGADVLIWGGNEHYQLGTGKRSNQNAPTYIAAPGGEAVEAFRRFQVTPRKTVRVGEHGKGRKVSLEQKVECGRHVTCVYSAA